MTGQGGFQSIDWPPTFPVLCTCSHVAFFITRSCQCACSAWVHMSSCTGVHVHAPVLKCPLGRRAWPTPARIVVRPFCNFMSEICIREMLGGNTAPSDTAPEELPWDKGQRRVRVVRQGPCGGKRRAQQGTEQDARGARSRTLWREVECTSACGLRAMDEQRLFL